jgi:hypothetical protein
MMWPSLSPLSIVVSLLLLFQFPLSLLAGRVDDVQLELLNVDEPLPMGQTNVIALLTKVWYTNYFRDHESENNVSNITFDFTFQDQETTHDGNSIVVTFLVDLSYDVPSTNDNDVAVDDVELLQLPFSEMEWVYGYSRSLRLSGGALSQFVGPVLFLSAAGDEIQPVRTTTTTTTVQPDESDVIVTSGNFDVLGLFMVLGVGAVALLLCTFAAVLLLRALPKMKHKEREHVDPASQDRRRSKETGVTNFSNLKTQPDTAIHEGNKQWRSVDL